MQRYFPRAPRVIRLRSADNHFQHAEVLRRNRQKRRQYREFFLEGVRPLNLALQHGWEITAFYYSPERGLSDWARDILRDSPTPVHYELPAGLLAQLSGKAEPSELIALLAMPEESFSRIPLGEPPLLVIFDRASSPGNLGTLIRSCDALGVDGLVLTGHGVDPYDPETISASRGSLFALPVVSAGGPRDLDPWLQEVRRATGGLRIVAAEEEGDRPLWETDLAGPLAVILGNEKWGLSAAYKEMADELVRIPMHGAASSLNVAVAGSILLYEVDRQRSVAGTERGA